MPLVMPTLQDGPAFDGMAVEDQVDCFARDAVGFGTFVVSGCQVTQDTGTNMRVAIAPGVVSINGVEYSYIGTGLSPLNVSAAGAGDRRDTVVLRLQVNSATPYVAGAVIQGAVPAGLVGAWNRNTNPAVALPPVKGTMNWSLATPQSQVDYTTDCVVGEVYVAFNTTQIVGSLQNIVNPTQGNIVDKTNTLAGFHSLVQQSFLNTVNGLPIGAPATTRRVGATLTSGDGLSSSTSFTDTNLRVSFILPVTPTRFRFKWTNQNASFGGSPTGGTNGAMTFTGIYVGQANIPANAPPNQWNGDFLGPPTQIDPGYTTGSVSSPAIYTTAWYTNSAQAPLIKARTLMVASIGWTNSGTSLTLGSTQAFIAQGTGCSTDVGTAAWNSHAGAVSYQSVGSLCIEYEYVGSNPVGLWVGDSITAGLQGQNSVSPLSILGPTTRYPERVGLRLGHCIENVAALGKSLTGSLTSSEVGNGSFPTDQYYSRIWFDNPVSAAAVPTIPDYAVILLGTNDFDNRWDNSTAIKSQYMQLVQTLRQGIGIQRIFALTLPPFANLSTWAFSRQLENSVTGGSSTTVTFEEGATDGFNILIDGLNTTVNQSGTLNSTNFTGVQTLTLTSGASANTGGGYAQVGGTGGCIIRYISVSGNVLQNVLFIKGNAVTLSAGSTAIVGANRLTLDDGYVDNSIWEEVYVTSASAANGVVTCTVALAGTVAHSHTSAGSGTGDWTMVRAGQETTRQQINAWLRLGPPGIDAVIDIGMATEFGEYNLSGVTSPRLGNYYPNGSMPHPYFWQAGVTSNAHPRSQAWHNFVAGLISPHLVGI